MSTKELIVQYVSYNYWANERVGGWLQGLTAEVLDKELMSSFPSIRKTVFHIWDAEFIWLSRLQGSSLKNFPNAEYDNRTPILSFINVSEQFRNYISVQEEIFFEQETTYSNLKGQSYTTANTGIIMHCMNHSTFHRGQLVTMLRNAGISNLQSTDLITYLRETA